MFVVLTGCAPNRDSSLSDDDDVDEEQNSDDLHMSSPPYDS